MMSFPLYLNARTTALMASFSSLLMAATAGAQEDAPLSLDFDLDRPLLAPEGVQTLYAHLTLTAAEMTPDAIAANPSVHIGLVLDRSGSMEGPKWQQAMAGAERLIDAMDSNDRLSIIGFDNETLVAWPNAPMVNPAAAKRSLRQLYPRGGTNISAGLDLARDDLQRGAPVHDIQHLVLLSDGQANEGILEARTLRAFIDGFEMPISALGLGLNYDEAYMQILADASGGAAHFIENANALSAIFEHELQAAAGAVIKGLDARFIASEGVTVRLAETVNDPDPAVETWTIGSMRAGATRTYLLELKLNPAHTPSDQLGVLQIKYRGQDGSLFEVEQTLTYGLAEDQAARDEAMRADIVFAAGIAEIRQLQAEAQLALRDFDQEKAVRLLGMAEDLADNAVASAPAEAEELLIVQESLSIESKRAETYDTLSTSEQLNIGKNASVRQSNDAYSKGGFGAYALGQSDATVILINQTLIDGGYLPADYGSKNEMALFSEETDRALRAFQADQGLRVDGMAGPRTLATMGLY